MGNYARWRQFTQEELEAIVASSKSNAEVARKLGYERAGGGTMQSINKMYKTYNLDTSHFTGQSWNKGTHDLVSFTMNSYKKNGTSTRKVLTDLRGARCEKCGLSEWLGQPINLEVHHINGDRTDNRLENLMLLCPNCHSYTPTFTRKGDKREKTDEEFITALLGAKSIHAALKQLGLCASGGNYERARKLIDKYNIEHLKK